MNREKGLDKELASSQRPIPMLFFKSKFINTEIFLSKSSLNATKMHYNRNIKIEVKSLKRTTTHNFTRYCPLT